MPSSMDRSAPAENASLPEVTTTPLTAASADVCFTISSSSAIVVSSSTFIERPGMSQVTSAMPSASVSILKFLKAMLSFPSMPTASGAAVCLAGWAKRAPAPCPPISPMCILAGTLRFCPPYDRLDSFNDRCGAHAAADAQRYQRGRLVGAFEFVEHGAEDHRAGGAERMAERDRAAIDVDLGVVDVERLDVAQHHRSKRLVQFEQIDVRFLHARTFEQFFSDVDRTGEHHRGLGADIGEGTDLCPRLQAVFHPGLLAAKQDRAGAIDDPRRVAGVVHIIDALDFRMRLDRHRVEAAHLPDRHEGRLQLTERLHRRCRAHMLVLGEDGEPVNVLH